MECEYVCENESNTESDCEDLQIPCFSTPALESMAEPSQTLIECFGCGGPTNIVDQCCVMCKFRGRFNPDDWSLHNEEVRLPSGKIIGVPNRVVLPGSADQIVFNSTDGSSDRDCCASAPTPQWPWSATMSSMSTSLVASGAARIGVSKS